MSRDFENFEGKAGRQTGSIYFSNRGKRCLNRISSLRYEFQYTGQNAGAARRRFTALPSSRQMTKRYFTGKHVLMDIHRRENWFEELKEQVSVPQGIILSLSSSFPAPSHLPNCHAVLIHLSVWSPTRRCDSSDCLVGYLAVCSRTDASNGGLRHRSSTAFLPR